MRITIIAGARPNFVKISPLIREIEKANADGHSLEYSLVHTGQHYDQNMSGAFFEELEIPLPNINLAVGSGSQAEQTASILIQFENYLLINPTDLVIVVGDVTSTMACAIVTKKLGIKLAHIEGGIRSYDMTMPEEINRRVTDSITDYFFTTSDTANLNLKSEGVSDNRIFFVGNVMIDTLLYFKSRFKRNPNFDLWNLTKGKYFVLTLHRPSNVDNKGLLCDLLKTIDENCKGNPVVFPVHPRTEKILKSINFQSKNIIYSKPMGYLEFNYLVQNSMGVITDSGGITEETTVLGIPCITLRENTERPETCTIGTNELIGTDPGNLPPYMKKIIEKKWKKGGIPPLWDGMSSGRIISHIVKLFENERR